MKLLREIGFVAPEDTYLTAKFRQAGFVIMGRTNTPELGLVATTEPAAYGPTRNPWSLEHSTGGSSGGSAAAVAARLVPAAHANDGGGSIRIPASECGLVGLKPSRGRVSLGPHQGEALAGLAIEGCVTRSVRDTAGILDAICGPMPGDPYSAPPFERPLCEELSRAPGRLRIGLLSRRPGEGPQLHPECVAAVEGAARLLASLGHAVELSHPEALDDSQTTACFFDVFNVNTVYELDQIAERIGREIREEDLEPLTWASAELGREVSSSRYVTAVGRMHAWTRRVASWWESGFDLLLTPTIAEPPPRLGELAGTQPDPVQAWRRNGEVAAFTPLFNVTRSSTSRGSRRSRCRCTGARWACPSECSSWPPTAGKTCSSGSPHSSSTDRPGRSAVPSSASEAGASGALAPSGIVDGALVPDAGWLLRRPDLRDEADWRQSVAFGPAFSLDAGP
jgi:amidase